MTKYQEPLYLAFMNVYKAFDFVEQCFTRKTLEIQGIPKKYIRIVKNLQNELNTNKINISERYFLCQKWSKKRRKMFNVVALVFLFVQSS